MENTPVLNSTDMFYESKVALNIWRGFFPILLVFGTLGNLTTIIVLTQPWNRNSSIARYLTALAVSDLFLLWIAVPRNILHYGYGIDVRAKSLFLCKAQIYLLYLGTHCSAWFVVALTIERFISAWLPTKLKVICTTRKANIVILSLLTFFILLNAHFLYGMGHPKANLCYPINERYASFYFHIWSVIQLSMFFVIPLIILLAVNISIVIRVLITRRKTQTQVIPQTLTTAARERIAKRHQVTVTLISVNIVYMVCVTPELVFLLFLTDWVFSHGNDHSDAVLELIWAVVNALFYTNNAVNFILYFLSGSRFRKEVARVFGNRINSWKVRCRWNMHQREHNLNIRAAEGNIELQNTGVAVLDA